MEDRARQALAKLALEPEGAARFEPNSSGFRPGRTCPDAIEALVSAIKTKHAYVLDADLSGCFDNIDQTAPLTQLNPTPRVRRAIKGGPRRGRIPEDRTGHASRGGRSPLRANIALHGREQDTKKAREADLLAAMKREGQKARKGDAATRLSIIRYADDFLALHKARDSVRKAHAFRVHWLKGLGLELKPSKTRSGPPLEAVGGKAGFNFLGFTSRQSRGRTNKDGDTTLINPSQAAVKRPRWTLRQELRALRGAPQEAVLQQRNPIVKGWSR
jgi:RNA-directed DNA polymerase